MNAPTPTIDDALALAQSQLPAALPTIHRAMPSNRGQRRFDPGRPKIAGETLPDEVVYHSTVAPAATGSSVAWLSTDPNAGVSITTVANRDGSLTEVCPPLWTPYHAGFCIPGWSNGRSLGIEFENSSNNADRVEEYSEAMIASGAYRVATWRFSFGIDDDHVKPHREVAVYPPDYEPAELRGKLGRKSDPEGPWPEDLFRHWVAKWLAFFNGLPHDLHPVFIV